MNLEDAVTIFYNVLYKLRDKYIPIKTIKKSSYPPWYTPALIKIIKEKYKYHRKYKQYKNLSDYNSFSILRSRAIELEKKCYEKYIEKIEASIVKSPKSFWTYVKSKLVVGAFPNVMHYGESSADTGEVICDLFARYFKSTFLEPELSADGECASCGLYSGTAMSVSTVDINHIRILKLLKSLDLTKSGGPDLIPPIFIVNCADSLAEPLCILFKRSLTEGIVPKVWKSAFITPVYKKGDGANIENYRPISKICLFSKILERIVHTDVYAAFRSSLGDEQHGFVRNRSTTSNLLLSHEFITNGMIQRQVDVIYTDYSKCFDRIDHRVLLEKLSLAGIHGDLYRWFSSYIENRTQAVVLQGYVSGWSFVPSGVPQGSILGPLLFTLFIADIKQCFHHSYI